MKSIIRKEMKLSAHIVAYCFIGFGLLFLIPGYPILCGVFFVSLGIYQSVRYAIESNDMVFSALLPIAKQDVVKGKFAFCCIIELCGFVLMAASTVLRMTAFADSAVYRSNALMNANFFALAMALLMFGVFNLIFIGGFFRTSYKTGKPFVVYIIVCFAIIGIAEALYHVPGMSALNAFAFDHIVLQILTLLSGILLYLALTMLSYIKSSRNFEMTDL